MFTNKSFKALLLALVLALSVTLVACGGGDTTVAPDLEPAPASEAIPAPEPAPEPATEAEPTLALPDTYELTLLEWLELYNTGDYVVVDVRRPDELEELGKFIDSININNDNITESPEIISETLGDLGVDKDSVILVHCAVGGRAGRALEHFLAQGYENTFILRDRVYFTEEGEFRYGLNPTEWDRLYTSGDAAVVVDLRRPDELAEDGMLPDSINLNSADIQDNPAIIAETFESMGIAKTDLVLTHCKAGGRAARSDQFFKDLGYEYSFYLDYALVYPEAGSYEYPDWELPQ
ncbi:rhodanese-like domain-containing protein [Desulfuribacillus alkaliarsenatis]|uniref:Rhodanese domain-containing protein n=1 Tax=Desulfuribacillus alkaliarsenatis TaxID=766136 RepID=A0A1E5G2I7_9FIRM|nr:rhodanese-like domain-containing protein [Desulfuribacillus alkaliarsenatis]OEF96751.1 hypothetical protein BHF68_06675 [Desulfuribacillus alkaliarsenatis]